MKIDILTKNLRHLITEKHSLSTESTLDPTNVPLKNKYKKLRNEVTSLLRNAELAYISNELEVNKPDLSKSWKIIKNITGLNNSKSNSTCFYINNIMTTDKLKIAQEFNIFYVKIGQELAEKIDSFCKPSLLC